MDKMKETSRIVLTVSIFLFIAWWCGQLNYNIIRPHETADPALPYVVTADGKPLSLLSGYENLQNALGDYFDDNYYAWKPKLVLDSYYYSPTCGLLGGKGYTQSYSYFELDPYGKYPNDCSTYNGVTTASTKEELEAAFGTDCIKTDDYYAEIFIDGKEFDYSKKQDYPADFGELFYYDRCDEWFEYITKKYPNTGTITVLICWCDDEFSNNIEFYIYPEIT